MSGLKSRRKGKGGERELYEIFLGDGLDVQKCDASGAGKHDKGDFVLRLNGRKFTIEAKREKKLPLASLEQRKADSDLLIMRQDKDKWKVYMDLEQLLILILNNRS